MTSQVNIILAGNSCRSHAYLYDSFEPGIIDGKHPLRVVVDADTEFQDPTIDEFLTSEPIQRRHGVIAQVKSLPGSPGLIFDHADSLAYAALDPEKRPLNPNHLPQLSGFVPTDYLIACSGADIVFRHDTEYKPRLSKQATITIDVVAFFALAESCQIATGKYLQDIEDLFKETCLTQHRRLVTRDGPAEGEKRLDFCVMPWILTINGFDYRVRLRIIDTCAIQGVGSYRSFLISAGMPIGAKDTMKDLIARMRDAVFTHAAEVDLYALNDLGNTEALQLYAEKTKQAWQALDIANYYSPPELTIGSSVANMFRAKIRKTCHIPPDEIDSDAAQELLVELLHYGTAQFFREHTHSTMMFLAKVLGGRCRDNRPALAVLKAWLCDLDLAGCYAQGLRAQLYPFGRPCVIDYPLPSTRNAYASLAEFLKVMRYGTDKCELVPGLWQAHISLKEGYHLRYPQDFFPSWHGFNDHKNMNTKPLDEHIFDAQTPSLELDTHSGNTKIHYDRIDHSTLTSDGLEWILHACSARQRQELLDHLQIQAVAFYPASERVTSMEALRERLADPRGQNTCTIRVQKGLRSIVRTEQECYAWYGVNLGEFFVDTLIAYRKLYPKKDKETGEAHALNTLFKLIANTLFGIMVSPYFDVGNTTVGANVTARARAGCWYMEKGLNGIQAITDGVQTDLNKVPYPRSRPDGTIHLSAYDLHELRFEAGLHKNNRLRLAPLNGYTRIDHSYPDKANDPDTHMLTCWLDDIRYKRYVGTKEINPFVNEYAMRHLQALWPDGISVLHAKTQTIKIHNEGSEDPTPDIYYVDREGQFEFEMKDLYDTATFHSSANHWTSNAKNSDTKARSYDQKREYYALTVSDGVLTVLDTYQGTNPATWYLSRLQDPHHVPRSEPFVRLKLIKPKEWVKRRKTFFKHNHLLPGDSYWVCGLLGEFSLSSFTTRTHEQWKALNTEYEKSKGKYRQYVEAYFLNPDGTLDYTRMMETCQALIEDGCLSLINALDPDNIYARTGQRDHPRLSVFRTIQEHLRLIQGASSEEDMDTVATTVDDE